MPTIADFRYALRMLRKNPWFSAAIIVTLALGIGVNTTVFTLVNAVLFKPLPFPGGERLVIVRANNIATGRGTSGVSLADIEDFRKAASSLERLEAFNGFPLNLSEAGNPAERYRGGRVSPGLFAMLQERPVVGRSFVESDAKPGAEPVIVIGYKIWADRYGLRKDVVGKPVLINGKPATVIGVMGEGFRFPNNEDGWVIAMPDEAMMKRDNRMFMAIGLIKPGASLAAANADLATVAARLAREYPDSHKDYSARAETFHDVMNGGPIRLVFFLLLGAVGFVLLIACANVANMLLSRAAARGREISIRAALGASRTQIIRQLLTESLVLSLAGGLIGLWIASYGIRAFDKAVADVGKPYWIQFGFDGVVFSYFAAICVASAFLFGLAPALASTRRNHHEGLKQGARGSAGGRGWLASSLVVFQFLLAVVLLTGAGLMIRSFLAAQNEYAQIPAHEILHARASLPTVRYETVESRQQFWEGLLPRLRTMPNVRAAALISNPPGQGWAGWRFEIAGRPVPEKDKRPAAAGIVASSGYFALTNMPVLRGREFNDQDGLPGKEAVIISREFAAKHFANEDPIGRRVRFYDENGKPKEWSTIIGIVPQVRQADPSNPEQDPVAYVPYRAENYNSMAILLRTAGPPASMAAALRHEVSLRDNLLPLFDVDSLDNRFARSRWHYRVFGTMFTLFALIALGMAGVGIYAVISHATSRRTQEIGIRMALGARRGDVIRLVLSRGVRQLAVALVLGLAAAFGAARLMRTLLFNISPTDPLTFALVSLALAAAGLAACYLPARRASKLDPLAALRYE